MTEPSERVAATCPSCSPDRETVHEVLKPGGQVTVRCGECGHVHKTRIEEERTEQVDVVVSQDGDSFTDTVDVPVSETLAVGEEFLLDTDEAILSLRITSLELPENRRTEEAPAEDVATIWSRVVGNVSVNVTLHPNDGNREGTKSITIQVPGDHQFVVGETEEYGDEEFSVEQILVRDDATGYHHDKLDFDGDMVFAKDVQRLYARDQTSTAWSAW